MKWLPFLFSLLLAACDALPRDPDGTSRRVTEGGSFAVIIDPAVRQDRAARALLREVERRAGARARLSGGTGEDALRRLREGQADLVIGRFGKASPWATDVAFAPPLTSTGPKDDPLELKAAMANGENRWIMTVERASRAVSAEARAQ
ncbi:MAG: hypothetical protein ABW039_09845 [Sphingobium sp.]